MRLCGNFGFNRLIFILSLLLFSAFSHAAATWSKVPWIYRASQAQKAEEESKSTGYDFSKCDLSKMGVKYDDDGDPGARRDRTHVYADETQVILNYGQDFEDQWLGQGKYVYAQRIKFNVPQQFSPPLLSAIKKALLQGNCIAAGDLINGAQNGQLCEGGAYCFENTNDDGTKNQCGIMTDGTSRCKISDGKTEETNPDGTPKINIDCPAGQDCRRETDLDGYASQQDNKKDKGETGDNGTREIKGESGQTGTGSDDTNKSGGQGSAGSNGNQNNNGNGRNQGGSATGGGSGGNGTKEIKGTPGQDNSNESKGKGSNSGTGGNGKTTNQAGIGDGSGTGNGGGGLGTGNGKGNGDGDGEGDGNGFPELAEFDLNKAIQDAKENLTNKLSLDGISLSGGSCPSFTVSVFGASHSVDIHCQILDKNGGAISAAFMFIWGFAAVRIFLSA